MVPVVPLCTPSGAPAGRRRAGRAQRPPRRGRPPALRSPTPQPWPGWPPERCGRWGVLLLTLPSQLASHPHGKAEAPVCLGTPGMAPCSARSNPGAAPRRSPPSAMEPTPPTSRRLGRLHQPIGK